MFYKFFISLFVISSSHFIMPSDYQAEIDFIETKIVNNQRIIRDLIPYLQTCSRQSMNAEQETQLRNLKDQTKYYFRKIELSKQELNYLKETIDEDALNDLMNEHTDTDEDLNALEEKTMDFFNSLHLSHSSQIT